jgi:hypothetical protein
VANSGVITALDGAASQYVRGDGTLADFPTSTGGGSSVSYYLNSSVSQGTIGGVAYRQLGKTPIAGAGTDIVISANGYVASYLTDANDPALLEVPAGNFNCEFYFSVNSNNHNPYVYAEVYKYDGTTFTLIGSSQSVPEYLTNGTTLSPYYFAIPVTQTTLAITDRLAIRIYVNVDGRVVTLHTENGHLCQVVTTFSKGLTSLNNLTRQVQFFATGTSGTDFNISSSTATHTFNIPNASATNRGLITTEAQTIAGAKVFDNPITANSGIGFLNGVMPNISSNLYSGIGGNSQGISIITRPVSTNYTNNFYFPSASNSYTFPNATGTIALTSDISYPVTSVFGRTGAVVATEGDYSLTQLSDVTITTPTNGQVLKYNGTAWVNDTDANTGTVTSVGLSSATSGVTIGSSPITTSGTITLAIATASGSQNGLLSSTDWTTFNNKYNLPSLTSGSVLFSNGTTISQNNANFFWDNTNSFLGVGTNVPNANITSFSTTPAFQFKAAGTAPAITFSNTITSASLACVFGLATANNHFITGTAAGDMAIANQSTSAGAIIFGTGTFEKMRMSSGGNFGIGTSNPTSKLTVAGDATISAGTISAFSFGVNSNSTFAFGSLNGRRAVIFAHETIGDSGLQFGWDTVDKTGIIAGSATSVGCGIDFYTFNGSSWGNRMRVTKDGNVGIGTSNPTANLTIYNATVPYMNLKNASSGTYGTVFGFADSSGNAEIWNYDNGYLRFATNGTERMRITSGGNVLIGTTDSAINSGVGIKLLNDSNKHISAVSTDSTNANGESFIMYSTGAAAYRFYVGWGGTIYATSPVISGISDIRLKENIRDIKFGLKEIMLLKPRDFDWKEGKGKNIKNDRGFIAQEFEKVFPDLIDIAKDPVKEGETPYKTIRQDLIPVLVKAIQEQTQIIKDLEARIKQLENK